MPDETKTTKTRFYWRARAWFRTQGIEIKRVITENGPAYRSRLLNAALAPGAKHKYTRGYRPQTNGKVERFHRTLTTEWARAQPYGSKTERAQTYQAFIHH